MSAARMAMLLLALAFGGLLVAMVLSSYTEVSAGSCAVVLVIIMVVVLAIGTLRIK